MSTTDSKYYTPGIEEFHVGFEYEVKMWNAPEIKLEDWAEFIKTKEAEKKVVWVPKIWKPESALLNVMNIANDGDGKIVSVTVPESIRVKHLDREDIEELGWEHDSSISTHHYFYLGGHFDNFNFFLSLELSSGNVEIFDSKEFREENFNGTIKNKSELRKLMQMLQIENENK